MESNIETKLYGLKFYQKFCDEIKDLFSKGILLEKKGSQGLALYRRHFFSDNFTNRLTGESSQINGEALMLQVFSFQGILYYYSEGRFRFWLTNNAKHSIEWLKGAPTNNQIKQKRAWSEPLEPSNLIVMDPEDKKGSFSWKHSISLRGSSEVFVCFSNGYLVFSKTLLLQSAEDDGETLLVRDEGRNVFIYWYESASFEERFSGRIPIEHVFFNHMGINFEFRSETFLQWYQDYIKKGKLFSGYILYKANVNFTGGSPEFMSLLEDITANLVSLNILDSRAIFFWGQSNTGKSTRLSLETKLFNLGCSITGGISSETWQWLSEGKPITIGPFHDQLANISTDDSMIYQPLEMKKKLAILKAFIQRDGVKGYTWDYIPRYSYRTMPVSTTFIACFNELPKIPYEEANKKRYLVVPALQVFHPPGTVDDEYSARISREASFECANYFYYACICVYKLMCKEVYQRFQCKESNEATAAWFNSQRYLSGEKEVLHIYTQVPLTVLDYLSFLRLEANMFSDLRHVGNRFEQFGRYSYLLTTPRVFYAKLKQWQKSPDHYIDRREQISFSRVYDGLKWLSALKYRQPAGYFWPYLRDKGTNPQAQWTQEDLENKLYKNRVLCIFWDNKNERFVDSQCSSEERKLIIDLLHEQRRVFFEKKLIPQFTSKSWENRSLVRKARRAKNENKFRG